MLLAPYRSGARDAADGYLEMTAMGNAADGCLEMTTMGNAADGYLEMTAMGNGTSGHAPHQNMHLGRVSATNLLAPPHPSVWSFASTVSQTYHPCLVVLDEDRLLAALPRHL